MSRSIGLQLALALVGVTANSLYNGSWRTAPTLIYDVPASLIVFSFIAQVLIEWAKVGPNPYVLYRSAMIVAMFVVTSGRQYLHWSISGHLSCALAVALIQSCDPRLYRIERVLYCLPVPIVLYLRFTSGDFNTPTGGADHWQTYSAAMFAAAWGLPGIFLGRRQRAHTA